MNRRHFVKSSIVVSSGPFLLSSCGGEQKSIANKSFVNGFIFSDAHIGWKGADQPSLEQQKLAINVIRARFPKLDMVFDTGDIHHGYLNENERNDARDFWLSNLVSPFSDSLFSYIPGNHELGKGPTDEEITATKLGSQNFRPYYSFDYCGIHFISLPQLLDTILLTQESLNWLEHDLSLNRDKTTFILSHNSIKGTTFDNGETGYRVTVNSEKLLEIINKHNHVVAWLHGHNHQYQIVPKHNRMYVSNGRIGGFSPPKSWGDFGQGHLGGVYFEINKNRLLVRCFSASKNKFFDEMGHTHLSHTLTTNTSFDPQGKCNYYCGHGLLTDNVSHNISNHYLTDRKPLVSTKSLATNIINENHEFGLSTDLYFTNKRINRVIGFQVLPKPVKTEKTDKGLVISNIKKGTFILNIPTLKVTNGFAKRGSYYRCESKDTFLISTDISTFKDTPQGSKLELKVFVFDKHHNILHESDFVSQKIDFEAGNQFIVKIPELDENANEKYLKASVEFINVPQKIKLNNFIIRKKSTKTPNNYLFLNERKYLPEEGLKTTKTDSTLSLLKFSGQQAVSTVLKYPDIKWQVRNAVSELIDNTILVKKWRHTIQKSQEVVITPLNSDRNLYLNKTLNLMPFTVTFNKNHVKVELEKTSSSSVLVFRFSKEIKKVLGSNNFKINGSLLFVFPESRTVDVFI